MSRSMRFIPKKGKAENLENLPQQEGQFIVTIDNRKIFLDAPIDGVLQRIPLGGDISSIGWDIIIDKPFDEISTADFTLVPTNVEETSYRLFVSNNLKFSNKTVLDKFSENENHELLYDNQPIGEENKLVLKGRVDAFNLLSQVTDPQNGWVFLVGAEGSPIYNKAIYLIDNVAQQIGHWEWLYTAQVQYSTLLGLPTINNVVVKGDLSLEDLGIVSGGYITKGSILFANLPSSFTSIMDGWVYNISDSFTTDSRFVEGSGISYSAGTNVVIVRVDDIITYSVATLETGDNPAELGLYEESGGIYIETEDSSIVSGKTYYSRVETPAYKFDVLGGFIDITPIETKVTATQSMLAAAFDSSTSYSVGDFVIYEDKFYKCTTTHSGTWSSADFAETKISDEMGSGGGGANINVINASQVSNIIDSMSN